MENKSAFDPLNPQLSPYRGLWVAMIGEKVVGQGASPEEAQRAAALTRRREKPVIRFIPPLPTVNLPPYFFEIQKLVPAQSLVYLVGGAVRDMLLQKPVHDIDFVVKDNVQSFARKVANALQGAYFCMNEEFDVARVIFHWEGQKQVADFVAMQGETIEEDLRNRDFTINAIAIEINTPTFLIDPLHGAQDLLTKKIVLCAPSALADDPIRIMRALRMAHHYQLSLSEQTIAQIHIQKKNLPSSSPERIRDELFKIFHQRHVKPISLLMAHFELTHLIFPASQHTNHQTSLIAQLDQLQALFHPTEAELNRLRIGMTYTVLYPYRKELADALQQTLSDERTAFDLLYFALFTSLETLKDDCNRLRLSNAEQLYLRKILQNYQLIEQLPLDHEKQKILGVYHFYQNTQDASFATILFALAHFLESEKFQPNIERIQSFLEKCESLLDSWKHHYDEWIDPQPLIDGRLLMRKVGISPGPKVGQILEAIREAQIVGEVTTQAEAIRLGKTMLNAKN